MSVSSIASGGDYSFVCSNSPSDYLTVDVRYDIPDSYKVRYSTMRIFQPGKKTLEYKVVEGDDDPIYGPETRGWWERHQSGSNEDLQEIGWEKGFYVAEPGDDDNSVLVVTTTRAGEFISGIFYIKRHVGQVIPVPYKQCSRIN